MATAWTIVKFLRDNLWRDGHVAASWKKSSDSSNNSNSNSNSDSIQLRPQDSSDSLYIKLGEPIKNGNFDTIFNNLKNDCNGKKVLIKSKLNCSAKTFFQCFISDDASWPVNEFHKIRKDIEVNVSQWNTNNENQNIERKITLKAKVNAPIKMGPDVNKNILYF